MCGFQKEDTGFTDRSLSGQTLKKKYGRTC